MILSVIPFELVYVLLHENPWILIYGPSKVDFEGRVLRLGISGCVAAKKKKTKKSIFSAKHLRRGQLGSRTSGDYP